MNINGAKLRAVAAGIVSLGVRIDGELEWRIYEPYARAALQGLELRELQEVWALTQLKPEPGSDLRAEAVDALAETAPTDQDSLYADIQSDQVNFYWVAVGANILFPPN
jgi:hypothetical protein